MATSTSLSKAALVAAAALVFATSGSAASHRLAPVALDSDELSLIGFAGHVPDSTKPKVTAYFPKASYGPGSTAELRIADHGAALRVQVFRAGTSAKAILPNDVITGSPVSRVQAIGDVTGPRTVPVHIGNWPSGFYYAQITAYGDRVGYATFVLRPKRLGEHSVAIVLPTQTWEAYNFRDDNGDHIPDTWYRHGTTARLVRPFLDRGVPPHYKHYDARFLAWAYRTKHQADYLSDADLNGASGAQLRNAYQLLIFEGHHEYVTEHEYDAVTQYRDLGGNLAFLSANNFFWKISIANGVMTRVGRWRDLGRPEAALIGVEYYRNDRGGHRGPWVLTGAAQSVPWLFSGTGLDAGMPLAKGGIEADDVTPDSPKDVRVIASIPNLYGDGRNADMTYYETPNGAKVFAAGAFTIAGWVWARPVGRLMDNLWAHMSAD